MVSAFGTGEVEPLPPGAAIGEDAPAAVKTLSPYLQRQHAKPILSSPILERVSFACAVLEWSHRAEKNNLIGGVVNNNKLAWRIFKASFVGLFPVFVAGIGYAYAAPVHLDHGGAITDYNTIQAAANAAVDGDTISVDAGTYIEQVTITKAITLQGAGSSTIIQSPANAALIAAAVPSLRGPIAPRYAVLNLETSTAGLGTVTVRNLLIDGNYEGFTQFGPKQGTSTSYFIGIATFDTNAVIDSVTIQHMAGAPLDAAGIPFNGWGIGFGIMAEGGATLPAGGNPVGGGPAPDVTVTIQNSTIDTFQKAGIIAWGPNLNATISNNHISGAGIYGNSGQNGMQIGSSGNRTGTAATVSGNTIDNLGAPDALVAGGYTAAGIYPVTAGTVTAYNNTVALSSGSSANSLVGIDVSYSSDTANLHDNTFSGMLVGVQVDTPSTTAVHGLSSNTLSTSGGYPVVFHYDPVGNGDTGGNTIASFGTGYSIRVVGENFSSGTATLGNGSGLAANSIQLSVFGGNSTLHIDTTAAGAVTPVTVMLNGVYQLNNFVLQGEYIRYAGAPIAATGAAAGVTAAGATLNGTVNDNYAQTTVTFEYGTTTGYGASATATPSPIAAGAGSTAVTAALGSLGCNTTYHYRVVATNGVATSNGSDQTFTTSACVPGAPGIGTATTGNGSATVSFTPGADGGAPITGYTVSCTGGGMTLTGTGATSPISVAGLTNGTAYSCSVTATNSAGTGAPSGTVSVTPLAAQAITDFAATPASGAVGGTATLSATGGTSGNPVVYASSTAGVCSVSGNTVSFIAAGTCMVTANQAGSASYSAAPEVSLAIPVAISIPVLSQSATALLLGLLGLAARAAHRREGLFDEAVFSRLRNNGGMG